MKIEMLKNGMDSLRRGFHAYLEYEQNTKDHAPDLEDYFVLKQAIIYTHHGIEILLKYIINKKSEFLIISEVDKNYRLAYADKEKNALSSVFNTKYASNIHTISFEEAMGRAKDICGISLSDEVISKLRTLNSYRNALTHAEIDVDDEEIRKVFNGMLLSLDTIFLQAIGTKYDAFYGFSEIKANYDQYMEYYEGENYFVKKLAFEAYTKALEKTKMYSVGERMVAYTEEKDKAKVFLKEMQETLNWGLDLYNGFCSGKAKISFIDDYHISVWTYDNQTQYIMKFKSMSLFVPKIKSNGSPILILESSNDTVEEENKRYIIDGVLRGICINDHMLYDPNAIYEFEQCSDCDDMYIGQENYTVFRFFKECIWGCFNIQGLPYWNFRKLFIAAEGKTGREFKEFLEEVLQS